MNNYPKISVITPSFNQGQFLEQTILSVLGQNYPNLEYIIIDGGSSDNSVEIIKKYSSQLTYWISESDNGQSHAINKGFRIASGNILCWLNSDDMFMPHILQYIAESIDIEKKMILTGNCLHYLESNDQGVIAQGCRTVQNFEEFDLFNIDYLSQPSTFWTRKVWKTVGELNEQMHYVFDWEWFIRAKLADVTFTPVGKTLSLYRQHETHKTATGGESRHQEIIDLYIHYDQQENAIIYKNLLVDIKSFKSKKAALIRYLSHIFRIRLSDIRLLKILFPGKYAKYSNLKLTTLFYVVN
jgi:glycosyltransferase involved in cell wall biosynthesis